MTCGRLRGAPRYDRSNVPALRFRRTNRWVFRRQPRGRGYRAEWSDSHGHVVVDETPIGSFGEIEGPARWIDRTAERLGVDRRSYITQSYAELFFASNRQTG